MTEYRTATGIWVTTHLFAPIAMIHPDTAIYLGNRQSTAGNLCVMYQPLPCNYDP